MAKNCNIIKLYAERKKRFFGKSKLSFPDLILHSLRVGFVFFPRIIILSIIYIILIFSLKTSLSSLFFVIVFLIALFNFAMVYTFLKIKPYDFYKKNKFIKKI